MSDRLTEELAKAKTADLLREIDGNEYHQGSNRLVGRVAGAVAAVALVGGVGALLVRGGEESQPGGNAPSNINPPGPAIDQGIEYFPPDSLPSEGVAPIHFT